MRQVNSQAAMVAAQLSPVAAGVEAAGLMASLPGALALALLAGAHIGGEWSGRTMKNLLTQQGQRWRVLAAKLVSLWLAGRACSPSAGRPWRPPGRSSSTSIIFRPLTSPRPTR